MGLVRRNEVVSLWWGLGSWWMNLDEVRGYDGGIQGAER